MQGYGGGRVVRSLISYPCFFDIQAILCSLEYVIKGEQEKEVLGHYLSECLRMITESNAHIGGGEIMSTKLTDLFKPVDDKTGKEIADEVIKNIGLEVV